MTKNPSVVLCCNGIIFIIGAYAGYVLDKKTTVRVGLVQWQMRLYKTFDDVF